MIAVRRAESKDIESMAVLWRAMVDEQVEGADPNQEWWDLQAKALFAHQDYYAFLAADGGLDIGYVDGLLGVEPSYGAHVINALNLYVVPDYRHGGVSVPLIKSLLEAASAAGTDIVGWPTRVGMEKKPRPFRNFRPIHVYGMRSIDGAFADLEEEKLRRDS